MKIKELLGIVVLSFCVTGFVGCSNDESGFSPAEIQQALFDMKGTYNGAVEISYYQGSRIATFSDAIAVSKDSLMFKLSLLPIAELIKDEGLSKYLKEVGDVEVKAGYEFLQMDSGVIHFVLHPKDVVVLGGYGAPPSVRIEFSQIYGGDAETDRQFMMFNISPIGLWINGEKSSDFSQLVYHFSGSYK
ncbi:MAG TPA: DUF4840 domain-containing protein [Lachnospiraceae bacterium]|nr:DUF4840 domain-containing protein [Lachnospiraceae bacterium]